MPRPFGSLCNIQVVPENETSRYWRMLAQVRTTAALLTPELQIKSI